MVQRAASALNAAPLPAPGNRYLAFPQEQLLEMKNDSRGNAQIVLCQIVSVGDFRKMRQQVVELQRADGESVTHVPVDAGAERCCERGVGIRCGEHPRAGTRRSEQHLAKWRDPPCPAEREARAKKIREDVVVHVHAINFAHLIASEIGYTAEPVPDVVRRRSAASVEIESANPRSGRIGAKIGVTYGRIDLRQLLRA